MTAAAKVHVVYADQTLQCTTYLIDGPAGALLVDPGCGYWHPEVLAGIERVGGRPENISHALLTHCHVDHARGAYKFRHAGVKLVASPYTAEVLRVGGRQVWYEFPADVVATEVDVIPPDGEVLALAGLAVRVIYTPGHTPGCVSYLVATDAGLAAFTGDLIGLTGHPGWAGSEGFSQDDTMAGVAKLLAAAPDVAYQGHGPVPGPACDWLTLAADRGRAGQWEIHGEMHPHIPPPPGRS